MKKASDGLSCPFQCPFRGDYKQLYHHVLKETKDKLADKLVELVASQSPLLKDAERATKLINQLAEAAESEDKK